MRIDILELVEDLAGLARIYNLDDLEIVVQVNNNESTCLGSEKETGKLADLLDFHAGDWEVDVIGEGIREIRLMGEIRLGVIPLPDLDFFVGGSRNEQSIDNC